MINVYPYPFSKNVKSLPDPPPAKAREIKDIKNKIYTNDYSWLIDAINNLKKCFHLCNLCSQKFKYMRQIAEDSNVHYEHNWNDRILNEGASKDRMYWKFYENKENDNSFSDVCTDVKHNILKINGKVMKNHQVCSPYTERVNEKNSNGIIFSNSLYSNKNEILSFDKDVYIFVGNSCVNYNENSIIDNANYNINQNQESSHLSKDLGIPETIDSRAEEMSIHIKRHFKDSIWYFACEHIKFTELHNLNNENNNYDKINIFACDKDNISSMNECVLNLKEGNDLIHLNQLPINEIRTNEEIKEKVKEIHKFYINVINKANEEKVDSIIQNNKTNFYKENFMSGASKVVPNSLCDESICINKKNRITKSTNLDSPDHLQKKNDTKTQSYMYPPKIPKSLINELTTKLKNRKVSCCLKNLENNKNVFFSGNSEYEESDQIKTTLPNNYIGYTLKSGSSTVGNNKKKKINVNENNSKKNIINDVNINEFMMKLSKGSDVTQYMKKVNSFRSTKFDKEQEDSKDPFIQKDSIQIIEDRNITDNKFESIIKESCFLKSKENLQHNVNTLEMMNIARNPQNNNLKVTQPLEKNSLSKTRSCKDDFSDFSEEKINQIYEQKILRTVPNNEFLQCKDHHLEPIKQDYTKWHTSSNMSLFQVNNKLLNISKKVAPDLTGADLKSNYNAFTRQKSIDVAVQTTCYPNSLTNMPNTEKFHTKDCEPVSDNPNDYIKNDTECERTPNSIILPISMLKSSVCGLKNYENSKIRSPFTEISYNSKDDSNTYGTKEDKMNCSKNIDANSVYLTIDEKNTQETLKSGENQGNNTEDTPFYPFIKKQDHSVVTNSLTKKTYDIYHQHKEVANADVLSKKKESNHHDHLSSFRNPFTKESVFYKPIEKPEHSSEEQRDDIARKESIDKVINIPMGNIFNLSKQPSEINVHNRIYASDLNKSPSDTKKVIYFNNNYFFNIDKERSVENNDALNQFTTNGAASSSNFNNLGLEIYQNGSDGGSFKCLHNTLPNYPTLSKESFFDTSFDSTVSNETLTKLQKLRNKHFKNNELHHSTHRKKPILSKRFFESKKNYHCPNQKSFIKEDSHVTKENIYYERSRRNRANHVNMICDIPESPQEQEKIPKPLASQLGIQVHAYLKKTPSYPFEYEF